MYNWMIISYMTQDQRNLLIHGFGNFYSQKHLEGLQFHS